MKDFKKFGKTMKTLLVDRFSKREIEDILYQAEREYIALLPRMQYIGGFKNSGTKNLTGSAVILSYIRIFERYGLNEREIGEIIYKFFESFFKPKPKFIKYIIKFLLTRKFIKKIIYKKFCEKRMYEKYEGSWQTKVIEPKNNEFIIGLDVHKCGICKFYKEQNASKYIKYMCLGDYPMFHSFGIYLQREKTVATSGEVCDYRLSFNKNPKRMWPPEDLMEWKNTNIEEIGGENDL